ncbi:hypothetical protein C7T35_01410 [Variovorax sp. WS11]|uniref:RyR domain-containing protein n=1 Tax=Variovorax sp. WS11 TaxID=1105204 RepID=UPI000D0D4D0F|nr:RyR domain-containing protein [Variovorax sp. WS11]NDZ11490.1 hypothetical protein [Variovorax sp. WS11]PSL86652.1 hypothetical protein C7T35_01410 [Variovorax sp. WS11]
MNREQIAQVAHEVNRAYCQSMGDNTVPEWSAASDHQRESILAGVDMHLANPDVEPAASHLAWFEAKLADGWVHGPVKNLEAKEHPCMVPYEDLPPDQRAKDFLFRGVVHALAALPAEPDAKGAPAAVLTLPVAAVGVKYVGRRDPHADTLYGSGSWAKNQVKAVTAALARQLLKHADVFIEVPLPAAASTVVQQRKAGETQDDLSQELRDQVQNMDKAALRDLAMSQFRMKIDGRLSLADTRAQVVQLIDQFGT